MADIVNLRQFKKRKAKDAKEQSAAENRIVFGRTKTEKQFDRNVSRRTELFLDGNRLETDVPPGKDKP
ncbi:DUF4169 family protein [Phyllobacterium myrsinacearum]|uniref:DUF4169 domain-containing protein n=1 Tax=Phyllobacterium myrsinacearum TaxID=28101 RepID=A0A2S9JXB5_9HYPH|nr:DUF4169 family protein [Phyllobacterium myrsinacearum]PRD57985.1 DUF4169 domain-containing protein [Phyllobacterium myrsinacearum]PWV96166.1 uncharacterized protein DUF4169 [Phyllobacterium myrsinacearum]RZV09844.1 uncharacterized protein DUF4169 [Phyllobacterium myrsinacearum]